MSRSDDDEKQPEKSEIAIPGFRAPGADEPRHRPPSVQRSERVRPPRVEQASTPPGEGGRRPGGAVSGAQPAVGLRGRAVSGAHAAVGSARRPEGAVSGGQPAVGGTRRATRSDPAVDATGRVVSGAHAAVSARSSGGAVSGAHAAVSARSSGGAVSGAHAAVSARSSGGAVSGAHAAVSARSSGGAVSGAHAAVSARSSGSTIAGASDSSEDDGAPPRVGPPSGARGIAALQAEVARDDVRVLARQLVDDATYRAPRAAAAPRPPSGSWRRWRPYLAAVIVAGALLFAWWPLHAIHAERAAQHALEVAVQRAAMQLAERAGAAQIAGWIRARDLQALRALYTDERSRIVEAVKAAGFEDARPEDISIRVDYDKATLVVSAQVAHDALDGFTASANLAGEPVGRPAPSPAWGPIVADRGVTIMALVVGAAVAVGAMWAVPAVASRRRRG